MLEQFCIKPENSQVIGFTCGAFDLTHAGHYLMLEDCKRYCDYLVVGLQIDPSRDRAEKNKPVQSLEERLIQLRACKFVDMIIPYYTEKDLFDYLDENKKIIDIRFLGEDWKRKDYTGKDLPIRVLFNKREHEFSSSSLRSRVYKAEKNKNV